jgi:hypothetical protein
MGDRKPIGVAYRDQDIDGGEIGRTACVVCEAGLVRAFSEVTQLTASYYADNDGRVTQQ